MLGRKLTAKILRVVGAVLWVFYAAFVFSVIVAISGGAWFTVWHILIVLAATLVPYSVARLARRLNRP